MPAEEPEGDGTLRWIATTVCVVHAHAAGTTGMGWTYGPAPIAGMVAGLPVSAHCAPAPHACAAVPNLRHVATGWGRGKRSRPDSRIRPPRPGR